MTTPPVPQSLPGEFRITELGELITGLPGQLGFIPVDSLVLATFSVSDTHRLGPTMRVGLDETDDRPALVDRLRAILDQNDVVLAFAVIVGGGDADPPDLPHRELTEFLATELAALGVRLPHSAWVPGFEPGATWWCYEDEECTGQVPDPHTSALVAMQAVEGMVTFASREDMFEVLAPDDEDRVAHRAQLLAAVTETEAGDVASLHAEVRAAVDAAAAQESLPEPDDEQIVRLAVALTHQRVRDACLILSLDDQAAGAERLWMVLVRTVPPPERAEPACLLALCAYLRGSAVLAGMAMEVALDADPDHRMTFLLRKALDFGTPPETLRDILATSVDRATRATHNEQP
ncbi:DUF4192 domain-containing protein [Actinophytocola sediminis]